MKRNLARLRFHDKLIQNDTREESEVEDWQVNFAFPPYSSIGISKAEFICRIGLILKQMICPTSSVS